MVDPTQLAKAWLVELIAAAPLAAASRVPVADLAREAPALCALVLAAVADDDALQAIRAPAVPGVPAPEADVAVLAARAGALAGAVDAAGTVAALEALRTVVTRALRHGLGPQPDADHLADATDRLAHVIQQVVTASLVALDAAPAASAPVPDIAIQDTRDSWAAAISRALERHARDDTPFALLAGEVTDRERWLQADPAQLDAATDALEARLPTHARVVVDEPGRWWVVIPEADDRAARDIAHDLADAVEAQTRVGAAFGVAVCPLDGVDAEALVSHADEALFSARAAGLPVA